jgi:hypothetical protein
MSEHIMIKATYQGQHFLHGIPARDISVEEWEAFEKATQTLIKDSQLYKVLAKPKKVSKNADGTPPEAPEQSNGGN